MTHKRKKANTPLYAKQRNTFARHEMLHMTMQNRALNQSSWNNNERQLYKLYGQLINTPVALQGQCITPSQL